MGELFTRVIPKSKLSWTGGRLTTDVSGQVEIEHLHRYFFARALCRNLDVLDIASGEGYGAALLAQTARSVVGIEISAEAVAHARAAYERPGLKFVQGDARRIELPDASVDAVVSFETIEHFYEHDLFLAEVRRVLRPGGIFIVSSPERDIYSPAGQQPNPYHVRELTRSEFGALLAGSFRHVSMYAQRPLLGAAIMAEAPPAGAGPLLTFERRGDQHFECSTGLSRPLYLIAVASDAPFTGTVGSLYVQSDNVEAILSQIESSRAEAEDLRQRFLNLSEQAEIWRQQVLSGNAHAEELRERLRHSEAEAEELRQQVLRSEAEAEELRQQLMASHAAQAALHQTISELTARAHHAELRYNAVLQSASWRVTAPLRGIAARHPAIMGRLHGFVARHPTMWRLAVRALRRSWRIATLRFGRIEPVPALSEPQPNPGEPVPAPGEPQPEPAPSPIASPPLLAGQPRLWFFLGDTINWLSAHHHVTGVGRVTAELFFASLGDKSAGRAVPCALAGNPSGLGSISLRDSVAYLASRVASRTAEEFLKARDPEPAPPVTAFAPKAGDHVLFTGVVWTPDYVALFRHLAEQGIRFSVFVHDIIPIEHPSFVSEAHHEMFSGWLRTVLALASAVFVSSPSIKDQVLRWAALSAVPVAATVIPVEFGSSEHQQPLPAEQLATNIATSRVRLDSFVLSVGTIDHRKNQALLCRLWRRLIDELGMSRVPQLVLVGRDDLQIASSSPDLAPLFETSAIVVLDKVGDAELAGLYQNCLFTVFPSLSEGYGLPVAESLEQGKLCIASDLAVIREHAGDLPWYFTPHDEEAAYAALRRAIVEPEARRAAEARIAREHRRRTWEATYRSMVRAVEALAEEPRSPAPEPEARPAIPGVAAAPVPAVLATAQEWCTELDPEVSILIINWNAGRLTRECVRQIWANTTGVRYEIILADNGSDPQELRSLEALGRGVRLLALGTNRYFGEANNIAAEHARGRYVCLLNNDAFVQPGWLRHLVDALDGDAEAGAAGPLFLFPDGTVQEAGGAIDAAGYPVRFGRGKSLEEAEEHLSPKVVDYISAAALLVPRDLFMAAQGFDLTYEPAYYEDVDLCFKLRSLGRKTLFVPDARVIHIEGASANDDPAAEARRRALGDLNRDKFTHRWGSYLRSRADADLQAVADQLRIRPAREVRPGAARPRKTAVLFTPYALTPGGGERFLLTTASVLAEDHAVTLVTPHPYSRLRLLNVCRELGISLPGFRLMTASEFLHAPDPDLMIVMYNHVVPPLPARARNSIFLCQFPFHLPDVDTRSAQALARGYRTVVTYSEYARAHVLAALSAYQMPFRPIEVVYPPVPRLAGSAGRKKNMILSVGRFFRGGHSKRQDLLISAFRILLERLDGEVELHLAGSSTPEPEHMDYLNQLQQMATGLPVVFHVNVPQETLSELYRDAAVYWHGTGLEADLVQDPGQAEHFGITIAEAMSAECVPLAFNAGGPREIIMHGVDGFLYASLEELADMTYQILAPGFAARRETMGKAAGRRAAAFSVDAFTRAIRRVIEDQPQLRQAAS
ncbi:MAG: glycosyltransferase [Microbispora sp.]|nr:glycosyltransferase [Microbispora sp.]